MEGDVIYYVLRQDSNLVPNISTIDEVLKMRDFIRWRQSNAAIYEKPRTP